MAVECFYPGVTAGDAANLSMVGGQLQSQVVVTANTFYQVFELSDTTYATPLQIRTPSGLTSDRIPVGSTPVLPDVYVQSPNFAHNWKSGDLVFRRDSQDAKDKAVADSVSAAQRLATEVPDKIYGEVERLRQTGALQGEPGLNGLPGVNAVNNDIATKALIESPQSLTSAALAGVLRGSKTEVDVRDYGAILDGVKDDTAAIRAAIATGMNVVIAGRPGQRAVAKTTGILTLNPNARGQRIECRNAVIQPAFIGDVIRVNQVFQHVKVNIEGAQQPNGDYSNVGMIAIGRGGANPKMSSVAYSTVQSVKGSGIIWEHGAHVDFTHFFADTLTHDGIRCDGTLYDDNNHGLFNNCHITKAAGIGYAVLSSTSNVTDNKSRSHQFINTKAFQCGQNYRIESINNVGTLFSELGISPDEYTSTSKGNYLQVIDDKNAFEKWIDNGQFNVLEGYSRFEKWESKRTYHRSIEVNNLFSGSQEFTQTGDYVFADLITRTNINASVQHKHGGTGQRTDSFQRLQLGLDAGSAVALKSVSGRFTFPPDATVPAGGSLQVVTTATGLGGAHIGTAGVRGPANVSGLVLTCYSVNATTEGRVHVYNPTASPIGVGGLTLRATWIEYA